MSFGEEIAKRERKSYAGFPAVGEADSSTRIPCDGYGRSRSPAVVLRSDDVLLLDDKFFADDLPAATITREMGAGDMAEPRFLAKAREREDSVEEAELGEPSGLIGVVGEENRGDAAAIAAADDRWAVGNGDSTKLDLMFDMLRPFMYLAGSRRIFPFVIVGKWAE